MKKFIKNGLASAVIALSMAGVTSSVQAQEKVQDKEIIKKMDTFVTSITGKLKAVYTTPIKDVYEVVIAPATIMYIDKEVKTAFFEGKLIDIATKKDLTEDRIQKEIAFKYNELPKKGFLKYGNGPLEIAVFADPTCIHCQRLEQELHNNKEFTVKVYPIAVLGPASVEKLKEIVCTKDKATTWKNWMTKGTAVPAIVNEAKCDFNDTVAIGKFANDHMIKSTPTIVLQNGTRIPGFMKKEDLINAAKENLK